MQIEVPDDIVRWIAFWGPCALGVLMGLWLGYIFWG